MMVPENQSLLLKQNPKIQRHLRIRSHYLDNVKKRINDEEWLKASELTWGILIQTIKVVALREGKELYEHRKIDEYISFLSRNKSKPIIYELYQLAEKLHSNFYEGGLTKEKFKFNYAATIKLVGILDNL